MNMQSAIRQLEKAWSDLYHNASLLGLLTPAETDDEARAFDEALEVYGQFRLRTLAEEMAQRFPLHKFAPLPGPLCQEGRGGATVYPHGWAADQDYTRGPELDRTGISDGGLTGYNAARRMTAALRWLNQQVKAECRALDLWWAEERKQYGYGEGAVDFDPGTLTATQCLCGRELGQGTSSQHGHWRLQCPNCGRWIYWLNDLTGWEMDEQMPQPEHEGESAQ